jgi:hypothetical protein
MCRSRDDTFIGVGKWKRTRRINVVSYPNNQLEGIYQRGGGFGIINTLVGIGFDASTTFYSRDIDFSASPRHARASVGLKANSVVIQFTIFFINHTPMVSGIVGKSEKLRLGISVGSQKVSR